ncbi:hypothetical protein Y032_0002g783 [Ancylostoma ceylanicum]|uniref:Uncharacterized protein n=1 Tax=Ancylostoma ceylanicum TaxID=53326 RepID=A0A016W184_9BILA|nr:hypothetical protein Y032_0002g783 [Ancylostoma ceylanicum]
MYVFKDLLDLPCLEIQLPRTQSIGLGFLIQATFGTASFCALINPDLQWILHIQLKTSFKSTRLFLIPLESVVKNCFCGCSAQELRGLNLAAPKI